MVITMLKVVKEKPTTGEFILFNEENYNECVNFIGKDYDNRLNYPNVITSSGICRVNKGDYIIKEFIGDKHV